jgi:hypothetical protein
VTGEEKEKEKWVSPRSPSEEKRAAESHLGGSMPWGKEKRSGAGERLAWSRVVLIDGWFAYELRWTWKQSRSISCIVVMDRMRIGSSCRAMLLYVETPGEPV